MSHSAIVMCFMFIDNNKSSAFPSTALLSLRQHECFDASRRVAPPPHSSTSHRRGRARVEAGYVERGRDGRRRRIAFRGGYHCRSREIGRKMGNPAAWWQMVDHRGRELLSLRPPALRGWRRGMGASTPAVIGQERETIWMRNLGRWCTWLCAGPR